MHACMPHVHTKVAHFVKVTCRSGCKIFLGFNVFFVSIFPRVFCIRFLFFLVARRSALKDSIGTNRSLLSFVNTQSERAWTRITRSCNPSPSASQVCVWHVALHALTSKPRPIRFVDWVHTIHHIGRETSRWVYMVRGAIYEETHDIQA